MRRIWMVVMVALVPATASAQGAAETGERTVFAAEASVLSLMSPEQFAAAGLGKLSPAELRALSGWDRGTVFQFTNGQLWRQSSFGTVHQFARSPKVTLVATGSGWRLQVEGIPQSIYLRRIK